MAVTKQEAQKAIQQILAYIQKKDITSIDPDAGSQYIDSLEDVYSGYQQNPKTILKESLLKNNAGKDIVALCQTPFYSVCEHHLLPFIGKAYIGYIPDQYIASLGSLTRVIDAYANRLQIQETLTHEIAENIFEFLEPLGVMVLLESQQACLRCRKLQKQNQFTTVSSKGIFSLDSQDSEHRRQECLSLFYSS